MFPQTVNVLLEETLFAPHDEKACSHFPVYLHDLDILKRGIFLPCIDVVYKSM